MEKGSKPPSLVIHLPGGQGDYVSLIVLQDFVDCQYIAF